MKKILFIIIIFLSTSVMAQETIVNYDEGSLPVLNEELRTSRDRLDALENADVDIDLTGDVSGVLPLANGGTGEALSDPGADRILFWDDSEGEMTFLEAGDNIAITGTSLDVTIPEASMPTGWDLVETKTLTNASSTTFSSLTTGKIYKIIGRVAQSSSTITLELEEYGGGDPTVAYLYNTIYHTYAATPSETASGSAGTSSFPIIPSGTFAMFEILLSTSADDEDRCVMQSNWATNTVSGKTSGTYFINGSPLDRFKFTGSSMDGTISLYEIKTE